MNMIPFVGNVLTTVVESSVSAEKKINALEALSCCLEATVMDEDAK
jgi:hypothetical protein